MAANEKMLPLMSIALTRKAAKTRFRCLNRYRGAAPVIRTSMTISVTIVLTGSPPRRIRQKSIRAKFVAAQQRSAATRSRSLGNRIRCKKWAAPVGDATAYAEHCYVVFLSTVATDGVTAVRERYGCPPCAWSSPLLDRAWLHGQELGLGLRLTRRIDSRSVRIYRVGAITGCRCRAAKYPTATFMSDPNVAIIFREVLELRRRYMT